MSTRTAVASGLARRITPEWLWVGAAVGAWVAAYRSLLPFWDWPIFELLSLDPATHWDIRDIVSYGVMATPAVVIDGEVVHVGGRPSQANVEQFFGA